MCKGVLGDVSPGRLRPFNNSQPEGSYKDLYPEPWLEEDRSVIALRSQPGKKNINIL